MYFTDSTWGWFRGEDNMSINTGGRNDFNESAAIEVPMSNFGTVRRRQLNEELAKYNLTENDVVIYKDRDTFTNEWKIILKQQNQDGIETKTSIGTITPDGVQVNAEAIENTTPRSQRATSSVGGF